MVILKIGIAVRKLEEGSVHLSKFLSLSYLLSLVKLYERVKR